MKISVNIKLISMWRFRRIYFTWSFVRPVHATVFNLETGLWHANFYLSRFNSCRTRKGTDNLYVKNINIVKCFQKYFDRENSFSVFYKDDIQSVVSALQSFSDGAAQSIDGVLSVISAIPDAVQSSAYSVKGDQIRNVLALKVQNSIFFLNQMRSFLMPRNEN